MNRPDYLMVGPWVLRAFLIELGLIHWLTLDHFAKQWRRFKSAVLA